jgi:DnaJ like chaperone protein
MSWFGKVTFGSLGLLFGGPLGAIAGAALGHQLVDKKSNYTQDPSTQKVLLQYNEQAQAAYFICVFSILGKLAKADDIVSQEEIQVVENFIRSMNISAAESRFAKEIFNRAKDSEHSIEDFAHQLFQINRQSPAVLHSFLDVLFQVAAADGVLHAAEETALNSVKNIFQVSDRQFDNIKARYFKDVDKYYRILNSTPESPNEEIKKNYKALVKDFHPDTIISKGLPEEFINFATKRFQEIQEAYEKIKKDRGL